MGTSPEGLTLVELVPQRQNVSDQAPVVDDGGVNLPLLSPLGRLAADVGRGVGVSYRRVELALHRDLTLAGVADVLGDLYGDRRLVVIPEGDGLRTLTGAEVAATVSRWSAVVANRVEPGSRVVVATPNGYDQLLVCLAVARAGSLPVPVNDQMRPNEIDHVRRDAGAALIVRNGSELDDATGLEPRPAATPPPDDVAALFYTSGTTGAPKGAELTHRALVGQLSAAGLVPRWLVRGEIVAALPVAHIMGFVAYLGLAMAGLSVVAVDRFDAVAVLDLLEGRRASGFIGVPTMYKRLLDAGAADRDLRSVRMWASGADVMPPDLIEVFKGFGSVVGLAGAGRLGQAAFVEGYGMVETAGGVAAKISLPGVRLGEGSSLGVPFPGVRMKVVDDDGHQVRVGQVGELWIKAPGVLRGYWNAPDATADALTADGWLRSGDLVRRGPFGSMAFRGRRKQVIKSGGYSVYPAEVEAALEEHPAVVEAAVVGMPHDSLGEVPVAAVRLATGGGRRGASGRAAPTGEELCEWAGGRLAHYKAPRRVIVVEDLPRTGTGKVQKDRLAEELAE